MDVAARIGPCYSSSFGRLVLLTVSLSYTLDTPLDVRSFLRMLVRICCSLSMMSLSSKSKLRADRVEGKECRVIQKQSSMEQWQKSLNA